jgi:hypothetical protein
VPAGCLVRRERRFASSTRRGTREAPCQPPPVRRTVPWSAGMRARRPSADGDAWASPTVIATPAVRVRRWRVPRRERESQITCEPSTRPLRHPRRKRRSPGTAPPGDRRVRGVPEPPPCHSPTESPRRPHLVGRHLRLVDCVEPADGGDRRQAGRVLEAEVGEPAAGLAGDAPRIFDSQVPDQCRGVSRRQVRPGPRRSPDRVPARRTRSLVASSLA